MRHQGGLALVATLVTIALLTVTLVLTPGLAARASVPAQGTAEVERPRFPLYFFLLKPNPQLAEVLTGLRLTEQQSRQLGAVLADEAQLISVSIARGTFSQDVGPIAQESWARLEREVLTREQYAAIRRWVATQDEFLLGVLREVAAANPAEATAQPAAPANGTPTASEPIRDLLAAVQTVVPGTPGVPANGTQPAATGIGTVAATRPPATVTAVPATATVVPATVTTVATTAAAAASPTVAATVVRPAGTASLGSITVVGQGQAQATPNVARLTVGVQVISDTVQLASGAANQRVADIIARIKGLGVADRDIQTAQYSIFPYTPPNERPIGPAAQGAATPTPRPQYRVDASVRVTVRDLNLVGQVIDGAIAAGANTVGGIQFTVDDPAPTMDQARANAFNDARRRAQQLAQLAGMTLGPPVYITEVIGSTPQLRTDALRAAPAAAPMAAPPIEGGELTYTTQLQITFEMR